MEDLKSQAMGRFPGAGSEGAIKVFQPSRGELTLHGACAASADGGAALFPVATGWAGSLAKHHLFLPKV